MKVSTRKVASKRWPLRIAAVSALSAIIVATSATAAFASGTYPTLANSNIRSGPSTGYSVIGSVPKGAHVTIDCYLSGENISGTTIWDHLTSGGYISDALVLTGSDSAVVPVCGSSTPPAPPAPSAPPAPAAPSHTYPTLAVSNVRSGTSTSTSVIATLPKGAQVTIDCYLNGQNVGGTAIWDHRTSGGYISDSLLLTGSDSAVVPMCGPSPESIALGNLIARDYIASTWAARNYGVPTGPPIIWGDDCTDFLSTALVQSGMPTTAQWTYNSSNTSLLASTHFGNPGPTKDFADANDFVKYMLASGNAIKKPISWSDNTASGAWTGDVIAYDWDGDGVFDHLAMVVSHNSSGYPSVVQNSPGQLRYWSWSPEKSKWLQQVYPKSVVALIHFVK
jgi:uncharacterized protein YraI